MASFFLQLSGTSAVTTLDNVYYTSSPLNLTFPATSAVTGVELGIWVWSGDVNLPMASSYYMNPDYALIQNKISKDDNYITLEISEFIKSAINPSMEFSAGTSTFSNEGVYFQWVVLYKDENGSIGTIEKGPTCFATLGYNWNYEGQTNLNYNHGAFGFYNSDIPIYQDGNIIYYSPSINLDGATNTADMIKRVVDVPSYYDLICVKEAWTIVYLNKFGCFVYFTPSGKMTITVDIDRDTYQRSYRNPKAISPKQARTTTQFDVKPKQSYTINTGFLREEMGELVEEILYSPMVYLIQHKGDSSSTAFTVDTTLITADTTLYTADQTMLGGLYQTFVQIPVICTDTSFTRKTKINDKVRINYAIKFEEANFKILNIR